MLHAEIIAIGSEMLTPYRTDTNSLWLTEKLNSIGIEVKFKSVVGDDEAILEKAIRDAMERSEIIISTGGLGPTEDDITKKIFARVLKRRMVLNEPVLRKIQERFAKRDMKIPGAVPCLFSSAVARSGINACRELISGIFISRFAKRS